MLITIHLNIKIMIFSLQKECICYAMTQKYSITYMNEIKLNKIITFNLYGVIS
jgi:hypothetical protein